jgi:hypothetical protein
MQNSYGRTEPECAEQLKRIPIIHLHGQLGYLPWQAQDGIPYGRPPRGDGRSAWPDDVQGAAKKIKIIHEDIEKDEQFLEAKKLLEEAEVVYFLGFGYNQINVERLKKIGLLKGKARLYGTGGGMGIVDRDFVRRMFEGKLELNNSPHDIMTAFHNFVGLE